MKIKHLLTAAVLFVSVTAIGETANSKQIFDNAVYKLELNKVQEASVLLQQLYSNDSTNMNVAYLLGQSYARLGENLPTAINLLEKASESYSSDYVSRNFDEKRVSEYVYYYLLMAYSLNGNSDKTIGTLNKFYSIYSYENEYYLIEGQTLHRQAQTRSTMNNNRDLAVAK